jgi:5-carboxymethyl-2-hydroxymuconate isomerase
MPHLILEHSDNLVAPFDHRVLCAKLHAALEATGEFRLAQIKSRVVTHERFLVGAGDPANIFVHLSVYVLSGRPVEFLKRLAGDMLAILRHELAAQVRGRPSDLTVDVREMTRETYAKEMTPP